MADPALNTPMQRHTPRLAAARHGRVGRLWRRLRPVPMVVRMATAMATRMAVPMAVPFAALFVALFAALGATPLAHGAADGPAEFRGADLALGAKLIREHRCTECHVGKVGGDGSAIYRPAGRINSPAALLAMVELCSTELKLQLFPEDVAAVAAVLQRDHYRFK